MMMNRSMCRRRLRPSMCRHLLCLLLGQNEFEYVRDGINERQDRDDDLDDVRDAVDEYNQSRQDDGDSYERSLVTDSPSFSTQQSNSAVTRRGRGGREMRSSGRY